MSKKHPIDLTGHTATALGTMTSAPWFQQALVTQLCDRKQQVPGLDRQRDSQASNTNPENPQAEAMDVGIENHPQSSHHAPLNQPIAIIIVDSSDDEDEVPNTSHCPSVSPMHRDHEMISIPLRYNQGPGPDCLYAVELPFTCSDNYKIVKVGASNRPGRRLVDIKQAFNAQSECTDFHCLGEFPITRDMTNEEVIEFTKFEPEVLFIAKYWVPAGRVVEAERHESEQQIRNAIGRPASREFTNAFLCSVRDPYRVKTVCGLSEWILCKDEVVQAIKGAFCNGQLDGDTMKSKEKVWGSWRGFVDKLKHVKQLPCVRVDYLFRGSEKNFTHNIPLPP